MRLRRFPIVCTILLVTAAAADDRTALRLGTGTAGGGFQAYGEALARSIQAADPRLSVTVVATRGSTENVPLLEQGRLDLALVTGEVAHDALTRAAESPVRVLTVAYPSPALFAVRGDAPYRTIQDLRGTRVVFGARGSGLVVLARWVLDGMGLDLDRDFRPVLLDRAEQGPELVLSGEASAMWGGGTAWPPFQRIAAGRSGARFLAPDADEVRKIVARHPFLRPMTIAAGSYPGQTAPVDSVGTWTVVLVRSDLPAAIVHRLARALHRAEKALASRVAQGRETTLANTAANVPASELHRGVLRLMREARVKTRRADAREP